MRMFIPACAIAVALGVAVHAQDSTVKSQTKVTTDDASTMVMTGCLLPGFGADRFMLTGAVATTGKGLESKSKIKTDVDGNDTKIREQSRTEIEDGKTTAGTSGRIAAYDVSPRAGVDLAAHLNEQVEISAVMIDAKKGDDDAKVKIKDQTKTENEDAPDGKAKSTTKVEVPRGAAPRLMAMSVKTVSGTCTTR